MASIWAIRRVRQPIAWQRRPGPEQSIRRSVVSRRSIMALMPASCRRARMIPLPAPSWPPDYQAYGCFAKFGVVNCSSVAKAAGRHGQRHGGFRNRVEFIGAGENLSYVGQPTARYSYPITGKQLAARRRHSRVLDELYQPSVSVTLSAIPHKPTKLNRWRKQEVCDGFSDFFAIGFRRGQVAASR